ncbi:hypothetical protein DSO57_1014978 [Entomophthora muscae]|uniref:Uncharacterized protein n=1 Tax=Entomophthora muscae TaxID=34485 RepID=A0ACC2UQL8_9FUNG|nr:hypothetical protein DSO57_1014978 [Entomophthora muscae]
MSRECKQPVSKEKSLVAHVYVPTLSPLSHLPPENPGAISCVPIRTTALILLLADPEVTQTASSGFGSTDPDASPLLCYPDSQEIEEDQLHRILIINALTRGKRVRKEPLIAPESWETVALPYAELLTLPTTEVTHESDSAKKWQKFSSLFTSLPPWKC